MEAIQPVAARGVAAFLCRTGRVIWSVGIYLGLLAVSLLMIYQNLLPERIVNQNAYQTAWMNMWLLGAVALVGIIAEMSGWLIRRRESRALAAQAQLAQPELVGMLEYGSLKTARGGWDLLVGLTFMLMVVLFVGLAANVAYHYARHSWLVLGCVATCALFAVAAGVAAYWRFTSWCSSIRKTGAACATGASCGCAPTKA